jgi:hypothetical protein
MARIYNTGFREYRRGIQPLDMSARWAGTTGRLRVEASSVDSSTRNVLRVTGSAVGNARSLYTFDMVEGDMDLANQQLLTLGRVFMLGSESVMFRLVMRGSANNNGYSLIVTTTGTMILRKLVNDVATTIGSAVKSYGLGTYLWIRFDCQGTTIRTRMWADGETEPGSWDVSVTDATFATGWIGYEGFNNDAYIDYSFASIATGGLTAQNENSLPLALEQWSLQPGLEIEVVSRFEYYDPTDDTVKSLWVSTHDRPETDSWDFPKSTKIYRMLDNPGTLSWKLEAENFWGAASSSRDSIKLTDFITDIGETGILENLVINGASFHGRPIETRVGLRYTNETDFIISDIRSFELVGCAVASKELELDRSRGTAVLSLGSDKTTLLSNDVNVRRNIGIATGAQTLTAFGWTSIPSHASYVISSFTVYMRHFIPAIGVSGAGVCNLSLRQFNSSRRQWHIALYQASVANVAHKLHFICHTSAGVTLVSQVSAKAYNLGSYVDIIFGVRAGSNWYASVNGELIGSGTLSGTPETASGAITEINGGGSTGLIVLDHRIENYVEWEEALTRFQTRIVPDSTAISHHRFDEIGSSSQVTDWCPIANHGTLQGSDVTDRVRVATYLGGAEVAGIPMPFSAGVIYNAPTQEIDSVRQIHRYNDSAATPGGTLAIRAKGLALTVGSAYTTPATGVVDMVGSASQPITYGLIPGATENTLSHVAVLIKNELFTRSNLDWTSCDGDSFESLRKYTPFQGGFHFSDVAKVSQILDLIALLGAHYLIDRNSRVVAGLILPPVNPGPYGPDRILEVCGYPSRGVTIHNGTYTLTQDLTMSLTCWFMLQGNAIDLSTSSTFTHFPNGMTLIDRYLASASAGYYLGFDGRDGKLIFGVAGKTGTVTGLHYLKLTNMEIRPFEWYCVQAVSVQDSRTIKCFNIDGSSQGVFENTNVIANTSAMTPLLIGHGPKGTFTGAISYVVGASPSHTGTWFNTWPTLQPTITDETGTATNRFWLELRDSSDKTAEAVQSISARVEGCRWAPRLVIDRDFAPTDATINIRQPVPAWQVDVRYKPNRRVISGSDVADAVAASDRVSLGQADLSALVPRDSTIKENYKASRDVLLKVDDLRAIMYDQRGATHVGKLLKLRGGVGHKFLLVSKWNLELMSLSLGDEIWIQDGDLLFAVRVTVLTIRLDDAECNLDGWGVLLEG